MLELIIRYFLLFLLEESLDHLFLFCPFSCCFSAETCVWIGEGGSPYSGSLATSLLDFIDGAGSVTKRRML